jgi:DNA/RNA-binding domain of Phe-tRNA-synthetase-like protein
MYKKVGIDPTKTRPSNEALLRRVAQGRHHSADQSAVDVVNWCSLEFQLPYGLYDASNISGPVTMRLGAEGEKYAGIRKDEVNVGGRITVADDAGAFGNPTSDSARTMVTPAATGVAGDRLRADRNRQAQLDRVRGDHGRSPPANYWRLSDAAFFSRRLKNSAVAL